jgi:tetratricopeptide (TPR) repeat protein
MIRPGRAYSWLPLAMGLLSLGLAHTGEPYFEEGAYGVRPAGMAEAFVAVADDANAVLHNPAGLSRLRDFEVTGMYANLYSGLNARLYTGQFDQLGYNFIGFALPLNPEAGTFGFAWTHFYSTFYKENVFALSYARNLLGNHLLDIGVSAKALHWLVEGNDFSANPAYFPGDHQKLGWTADAGLLFTPWAGFTLGGGVSNLVPAAVGRSGVSTVPLVWRAGASFKQQWQESAADSLLFSLEWEQREAVAYPKAGLEMWFFGHTLGIRTGLNQDEASAGLSLQYGIPGSPLDLEVDYAYAYPLQIVDNLGTHRIGMTFRLGAVNVVKPPALTPIPTPVPVRSEEPLWTAAECYDRALRAYYVRDWDTSLLWWHRLLTLEPANQVAIDYITTIQAYLAAKANLPARRAIAGDPTHAEVDLSRLANIYRGPAPAPAKALDQLVARAERCTRAGRMAEALETWETIQILEPGMAQAPREIARLKARLLGRLSRELEMGVEAFNAKDYLAALRQFRTVLALDPEQSQAAFLADQVRDILTNRLVKHYATGAEKLRQNQFRLAVRYFEMVSLVNPRYQDVANLLAEARAGLHAAEGARQIVTAAGRALQQAQVAQALNLLSPLMGANAHDAKADQLFEAALAKKTQSLLNYELGVQAYRLQDLEQAIGRFQASLILDQASPARELLVQALVQKGILAYRQNRLLDAQAAWESALVADPEQTLVRKYLQRVKNKIAFTQQELGGDALQGKTNSAPEQSPVGETNEPQ